MKAKGANVHSEAQWKRILIVETGLPDGCCEASRLELQTQLSDRRVELADLGLVCEYVKDLRNVLTYSSLAEQRSFIRSFVKEVKVTGTDALLTYTMPLPPQGITQEWAGVLNTVHHGGRYCPIRRTFCLSFSIP